MKEMDENEIIDFLMEGTRTGKLSTVQKDGRPHVAPIWFVWNKGKIIFGTGDSSVKAKNMRRNPQVSICVDDESPPYAFVIIQGTAKFSDNQKDILKWNTILGGRYMGEKLAEVYGKRNTVEGSLLVEVTPTKMISNKDVTGW
ncbi:MAG: PPOX class F420-dependent oxidoreductase [Thaumarchaeota archaeon]|nr:PPOX class F420-dependent oxidoreductase [Nitrososphaerota archaeon]